MKAKWYMNHPVTCGEVKQQTRDEISENQEH